MTILENIPILKDLSFDVIEERVDLYRSRYYNSRRAKKIISEGTNKLTKILTN